MGPEPKGVRKKELLEEMKWLLEHPEFEERPAPVLEFLGEDYLNVGKYTWPTVKRDLVGIFGKEFDPGRFLRVEFALLTGGVGTGKTTCDSIVIAYGVYVLLCLKDPQEFFDFMPGTKIALSLTSTTESQTKNVIFHDVKQRFDHSKWFKERGYGYNPKKSTMLEFPKDIWVIPGDSSSDEFLGANLFIAILEEIDDQKITGAGGPSGTDYGELNYRDLRRRVASRFKKENMPKGWKGLICLSGTMKRESGLAQRRWKEWYGASNTYCRHAFTWEANPGNDNVTRFFYFDPLRRQEVAYLDYEKEGVWNFAKGGILKIPDIGTLKEDFIQFPEESLNDYAGIPSASGAVFISRRDKILRAFELYEEDHTFPSPILEDFDSIGMPIGEYSGFREGWRCFDNNQYVVHIDLGLNKGEGQTQGDHASLGLGCVPKYVDTPRGEMPYFRIELVIRFEAPPGGEIDIAGVRSVVYLLRDVFGFEIVEVTYDGFESTESQQELKKKGISSKLLSVDKTPAAYQDLRGAIYDERAEIPDLVVWELDGRTRNRVHIIFRELAYLIYGKKKSGPALMIDHAAGASKDCSDCIAAIVHNLNSKSRLHSLQRTNPPVSTGQRSEYTEAMDRLNRILGGN